MQTTLRIDDRLYREAKAEAARVGVSLTRFLEEGLRLRLEQKMTLSATPHLFRTYAAAKPDSLPWGEICRVAEEEQQAHDIAKLGLDAPKS